MDTLHQDFLGWRCATCGEIIRIWNSPEVSITPAVPEKPAIIQLPAEDRWLCADCRATTGRTVKRSDRVHHMRMLTVAQQAGLPPDATVFARRVEAPEEATKREKWTLTELSVVANEPGNFGFGRPPVYPLVVTGAGNRYDFEPLRGLRLLALLRQRQDAPGLCRVTVLPIAPNMRLDYVMMPSDPCDEPLPSKELALRISRVCAGDGVVTLANPGHRRVTWSRDELGSKYQDFRRSSGFRPTRAAFEAYLATDLGITLKGAAKRLQRHLEEYRYRDWAEFEEIELGIASLDAAAIDPTD